MTTVAYSSYTYQSVDPTSKNVHDIVFKRQEESITGSFAGFVLFPGVS